MIKRISLYVLAIVVLAMMAIGGTCTSPDGGAKPDLIVQSIDDIDVTCTTSGCTTTVTVTIKNIGTANAGLFKVRVKADPDQAVYRGEAGVTELAAGATKVLTITTTPAGPNCYNPDCTVCVEVDIRNDVSESNEANNEKCETEIG